MLSRTTKHVRSGVFARRLYRKHWQYRVIGNPYRAEPYTMAQYKRRAEIIRRAITSMRGCELRSLRPHGSCGGHAEQLQARDEQSRDNAVMVRPSRGFDRNGKRSATTAEDHRGAALTVHGALL